MNCKIAKKIFAVFVCTALLQSSFAYVAYADDATLAADDNTNCKYGIDFSKYGEDTNLSSLGITQNATKETFEKTDGTECTSGAKAQIVYDNTVNENVLEFNPCEFADVKIGENLNFELTDKLYKKNGPFTISIRYNTPDVLKHSNGSVNMIGYDADGNKKILYFGDISYLFETTQRKYRRLMIGNSLWTSNSTLNPTAYLTMSDMSNTVNKYITCKYVVDPTDETFKFYYKFDDSDKWVEPYAAYELPTGPIPDTVTQLRFSLYENDASKLKEDSKYKIASLSVNQGLELDTSAPENNGKLKGKVIKLYLNSPVDADSVDSDSLSVEKDGQNLIYAEDYTVRLNDDEPNAIEIVLNDLPSGGEMYTVTLSDRINSVNAGFAKLNEGETICVNFIGAIDEGYVQYKEDFSGVPQGDLSEYKDGIFKYSTEPFSSSSQTDKTYVTVDTTKDGETAIKYKTNIDASGKGGFLNVDLPEPVETNKGNVVVSFSLYGEQPDYLIAGPQMRGYNLSNPNTTVKVDAGMVSYSNDAIRYPDGTNIYTTAQLKSGWYDLCYVYNPNSRTVTVKNKAQSDTSWTEKTFKLKDEQIYPDVIKTMSFRVVANSNLKTFGVDGIYWIDNLEISQIHTPALVKSTVSDGDIDVDGFIKTIELEYNMPIVENSANAETVKLMQVTDKENVDVDEIEIIGKNNSDGTNGIVYINILNPLKADTKYVLQTEGIEANTVKRGKSDKTLINFTTAQNYILKGSISKGDSVTVNAQVKANSKLASGKKYVLFAALVRKSDGAIIKLDFDENIAAESESVYSQYDKTFTFDKPQDLTDGEYYIVLRLLNGFVNTYSLLPKVILE